MILLCQKQLYENVEMLDNQSGGNRKRKEKLQRKEQFVLPITLIRKWKKVENLLERENQNHKSLIRIQKELLNGTFLTVTLNDWIYYATFVLKKVIREISHWWEGWVAFFFGLFLLISLNSTGNFVSFILHDFTIFIPFKTESWNLVINLYQVCWLWVGRAES